MLFLDVELGRPLLVQDGIFPDESGNGYALRMLGRNGLAFSDLANVVASQGHRYLPASAAGHIAYFFGSDTTSVLRAMPRVYKEGGRLITSFMGHVIGRPYHMRHTRPQICPYCIEAEGRALALWDLSLVTACPEHGCSLLDACQRCGRRLSWRRPDMHTCYCGYDLAESEAVIARSDDVWLSRCIKDVLFSAHPAPAQSGYALLQRLSLDCLLRLIRALGLSETSDGSDLVPGRVTRVLSSEEASGVVRRAMERYKGLFAQSYEAGIAAMPFAVWDLGMLLDDVDAKDWLIMQKLLERMAAVEGMVYAHSRWQHQLPLVQGLE